VLREVPAASNRLANLAMSSVGGGRAPLDPQDPKAPKTLNTWFEFELGLPATQALVLVLPAFAIAAAVLWFLGRVQRRAVSSR